MSAILTFLCGSTFRAIWGEVSAMLSARQEHRHELARLELQERVDAASHARNLEQLRLQSELGVKTVEVQRDADLSRIEADAWLDAVRAVGRQTGVKWLDAWNGGIRPLLATLAIAVVVIEAAMLGFILTDWTRELLSAILGIYVADRTLAKRGK